MKKTIINPSWQYSGGQVSFSATVRLTTDDYNPNEGTGSVLWEDKFGRCCSIYEDGDWYGRVKADLQQAAKEIVDQYIANMTIIMQKTQKTSIESIISDVVEYIEKGL